MGSPGRSFLGKGWFFPPEFSHGGRKVVMIEDVDDVQQSLEILFGTRLGERIMNEGYGSNLHDFIFAEVNSGTLSLLRNRIQDAILFHEPRIVVNNIELEPDGATFGLLWIELDYSIPASNTRFNMVYPFYLGEADAS